MSSATTAERQAPSAQPGVVPRDRDEFPAEIFATNPNPTIRELRVGNGGHRVLIVDDFYQYPEQVLALMDVIEFRDDPRVGLSFPGLRAFAPADLRHLIPVVAGLIDQPHLERSRSGSLSVQGLWGNTPMTDRQRVPHTDPGAAALLYLNREQDCAGGTGLYRHRLTGLELVPLRADERMVEFGTQLGYSPSQLATRRGYRKMTEQMIFNPRLANTDGSMLNDGNQHWELMELVEMRNNRLVIYDGRIPHTLYLEPGSFEDVPRFVQMLSIDFDSTLF